MPLQPLQRLHLRDAQGRRLGEVVIDRIEGDLVFGSFTPGPEFAAVQAMFAEFVEAANEQLLSIVARLDDEIKRLGLRLNAPDGAEMPAIRDVQIADGSINFRTGPSDSDTPNRGGPPSTGASTPVLDHDLHPA
jgi:hypothetical protein